MPHRPPSNPEVRRARARLGAAVRDALPEKAEEARRDLKVALAEDYIRELVETAPVPTTDQCKKLARLLVPAEGDDQ